MTSPLRHIVSCPRCVSQAIHKKLSASLSTPNTFSLLLFTYALTHTHTHTYTSTWLLLTTLPAQSEHTPQRALCCPSSLRWLTPLAAALPLGSLWAPLQANPPPTPKRPLSTTSAWPTNSPPTPPRATPASSSLKVWPTPRRTLDQAPLKTPPLALKCPRGALHSLSLAPAAIKLTPPSLVSHSRPSAEQPATRNQKALVESLGATDALPDGATKGEASAIISNEIESGNPGRRQGALPDTLPGSNIVCFSLSLLSLGWSTSMSLRLTRANLALSLAQPSGPSAQQPATNNQKNLLESLGASAQVRHALDFPSVESSHWAELECSTQLPSDATKADASKIISEAQGLERSV